MRLFALMFLLFTVPASADTAPCQQDAPCQINAGEYHIILPEGWDGVSKLPALVFFHGHNSSARSVFRAASLRKTFGEAGFAIIAPNGIVFPGRNVRGWPGRENFTARDDVAFTLDVMDDAAKRLPMDSTRIYAAGFSAGGSMVWQLACRAPERFAGFISVAGALRRPNPSSCPDMPIRLLQIHGFADAQVPFEGRGIRDWHQGDLFESLTQVRSGNRCRTNPDQIDMGETYRCRTWDESCEGGALKLCVHDGGHGLPRGWTELALEFLLNP